MDDRGSLPNLRNPNRNRVWCLYPLLHPLRKDMSKARALELCDRAELNPGPDRCVLLIEAIQELAKDDTEPDPNHANMDDLLEELRAIVREIRDLKEVVSKEH